MCSRLISLLWSHLTKLGQAGSPQDGEGGGGSGMTKQTVFKSDKH